MKKLSLFSLLGLVGLLAFVATPIYAQDEDVILNDEQIVAEAEDIVADVEDVAEDVAEEIVDTEEAVEDVAEDVAEEIADVEETIEDVDLDEYEDSDFFGFDEESLEDTLAGLDEDQQGALALTGLVGLLAGLGIAAWIIGLVWAILIIIAMWKIFERAGEAGWKSIIPIYNLYILFKIVGMKNWFWYALLARVVVWIVAFLPESIAGIAGIVGVILSLFFIIVAIVAAYKLPRKFGWGVFTSILFVLFMSICILILGFGNYKYQGKSEETVVEA